jgi:hypothetical protein
LAGIADLYSCSYTHDPESPDGLAHAYHLFIGPENAKNDVLFVVGMWLALAQENCFSPAITVVSIWSNGGHKHFKHSANLLFMSCFQAQLPQWKFIYNFFPSYHGDGICDGLAAHGKHRVEKLEKD